MNRGMQLWIELNRKPTSVERIKTGLGFVLGYAALIGTLAMFADCIVRITGK
jgi:hypothetical protein